MYVYIYMNSAWMLGLQVNNPKLKLWNLVASAYGSQSFSFVFPHVPSGACFSEPQPYIPAAEPKHKQPNKSQKLRNPLNESIIVFTARIGVSFSGVAREPDNLQILGLKPSKYPKTYIWEFPKIGDPNIVP